MSNASISSQIEHNIVPPAGYSPIVLKLCLGITITVFF